MQTNLHVLGIDEAGRGPVIGPMTVCGVLAIARNVHRFVSCGVKDSKMLSASRREKLQPLIHQIAEGWRTIEISSTQIDNDGLTEPQLMAIVGLIHDFKPDIAIIDAPTSKPDAYRRRLREIIGHNGVQLIVENKADVNYPVVAAASILAKLARDKWVQNLSLQYGNIGSGYPSDKKTISFLREYVEANHRLPDMVRTRWVTAKRLMQTHR